MTDRPILFSGPMVRALLDGRKTQTRRLATSPLRRVEVGDRLWVKETHAYVGTSDPGWLIYRATYDECCRSYGFDAPPPEGEAPWKPSIFMQRRLSRLTLMVTDKRTQRLQDILNFEARAEGIRHWKNYTGDRFYENYADFEDAFEEDYGTAAIASFSTLWNSLHDHPGERWADNPEIIALTFTVEIRNIDA